MNYLAASYEVSKNDLKLIEASFGELNPKRLNMPGDLIVKIALFPPMHIFR